MEYFKFVSLIVLLLGFCFEISARSLRGKNKPSQTKACEVAILPEPPCCGISNASIVHIYEDHAVALNELPWLVYIELKLKPWYEREADDTTVHCGGSLINSQWVLTAAHCLYYHTIEAVYLGERNCSNGTCGPNAIRIKVDRTIQNNGFLYWDFEEDIALLHLAKSVSYSKSIRPICLLPHAVHKPNLYGKKGIVAGWVKTGGNNQSTNLLKTFVEIWNFRKCKYLFEGLVLKDAYHMCARGENNISPCDGDSGGPLMLLSPNQDKGSVNFYFQLGIVSFGVCGRKRSPIVYTNVTNYVPWITEILSKN